MNAGAPPPALRAVPRRSRVAIASAEHADLNPLLARAPPAGAGADRSVAACSSSAPDARSRPRPPPATGSKSKKLQLLVLLPDVVALANKAGGDSEELIQSAATLGSFAYGLDAGVRAVVAQGAVQTLLRALASGDDAVVEAAARSLKLIYRVSGLGALLLLAACCLLQVNRECCLQDPAARVCCRPDGCTVLS